MSWERRKNYKLQTYTERFVPHSQNMTKIEISESNCFFFFKIKAAAIQKTFLFYHQSAKIDFRRCSSFSFNYYLISAASLIKWRLLFWSNLKISVHCVYTTVIYMYYDIKIENRIKNISGNIFQSETRSITYIYPKTCNVLPCCEI